MEEQDFFFGLEGPLEAVPAAGQMLSLIHI